MIKTQRPDVPRQWALILLVGLLLGAWAVRVADLRLYPPGIGSDFGEELADALRISRGVPYPLAFESRPEPAHRYLLAAWVSLSGYSQFSATLLQVFEGMLAVALVYTAACTLLHNQRWRRVGGIVAAAALAAMVAHIFQSRSLYRIPLVSIVVPLALILLLRAYRQRRPRLWVASGFVAGLGVHTYTAGLMTPLWLVGFLIFQLIFPSGRRRDSWRNILYAGIGLLLPVLVWLGLLLAVSNLYSRPGDVSALGKSELLTRLTVGVLGSTAEFYQVGFVNPLYNAQDTPFLNPLLAVFGFLGFIRAVWRWRRPEGALILGGLYLFTLPAALSVEPLHPSRLIGAMPLVSALAGWGAAWLLSLAFDGYRLIASKPPDAAQEAGIISLLGISFGLVLLAGISLYVSFSAYERVFTDPAHYQDPGDWRSIPHRYTLAYVDALKLMEDAKGPTYVPLAALNTQFAAYILERRVYTRVTTWASYGLTELPAGQVLYPAYSVFHTHAGDSALLQALLLPAEHTIVILPPAPDGAPVIVADVPGQTREIVSEKYGWVIARVTPRPASPLPDPLPVQAGGAPIFGASLELVGASTPEKLKPGKAVSAILEYKVLTKQGADVEGVFQLIGLDGLTAVASHQHPLYHWLYPSPRWQPGDIIPATYAFTVPPDAEEGVYVWATSVMLPPRYEPFAPSALPRVQVGQLWTWGALRIPSPQVAGALPPDAQPVGARFKDGIDLEGYRLSRDGQTLTLDLFWRARAEPQGNYTIFVHAQAGDKIAAQDDQLPQAGRLPTWAWKVGELVVTHHTLSLPADADFDALYVGLYDAPSGQRLPLETGEEGRILVWKRSP